MLIYKTPEWVTAATTGKGEQLDDDRAFGQGSPLALPRQTHTNHVCRVNCSCRPDNTDAVFTDVPGLTLAVKTADCIPVLLYDNRHHIIAAIHAGWKGTVSHIVSNTISAMGSCGCDLSAIIGPGISLDSFEVGDEVYNQFHQEGFPMERIACKKEKWHIDLWEANRWELEQCGVTDIHVAGIDTMVSPLYYSARRETINTGRNYNWIVIN